MLVTLCEVLKKAQREGYAVGLFNTINTDMLEAAISAAEKKRSPIIIGTAEVLLKYGELALIAPSVIERARRASVPVVVHYDHGLTFGRVIEAMKLGFSSVMYDCSTLGAEENIQATREVVKIAHAMGVSVEAEIGHVGGTEDEAGCADESQYTSKEDALQFCRQTGVDALAVAIGTAHGSYKVKPVLDVNRLAQIRGAVDTPLVLHGGSGLTAEDFKSTIKNGIAKVNIFTDLCLAASDAIRKGQAEGADYLTLRSLQVAAIERAVCEKMEIFGSCGKA